PLEEMMAFPIHRGRCKTASQIMKGGQQTRCLEDLFPIPITDRGSVDDGCDQPTVAVRVDRRHCLKSAQSQFTIDGQPPTQLSRVADRLYHPIPHPRSQSHVS